MPRKELSTATDYERIYLAPHPDDAIFSCGGTIALFQEKGDKQLVVTLCSEIPDSGKSQWLQRLDEDQRAFSLIGIDYIFGNFLDAPFRNPKYQNDENLFAPPLPEDTMPENISLFLETLAGNNRGAVLYAPLGIGMHVDHLITYNAADSTTRFSSVRFYEDFPYTVKYPNALENRLSTIEKKMTPIVTDIKSSYYKKVEAIGQYSSQIHFLFGSFDNMSDALIQDAQRVTPEGVGERSWTSV